MVESIPIDMVNSFKNQMINTLASINGSVDVIKNNPVQKVLTTEDSKHFVKYLEQLGLSTDTNMVVLSSLHHYYYDEEEMISVKTIINLKELNLIKELKEFLHSSFHILPSDCNFIGCFINNKKENGFVTHPTDYYYKRNSEAIENGIVSSSPFLTRIYNVIDLKTNKYLSERSVSLILGEHGFKVTDFTEIDGLTYFCAKSLRTAEK